MRKDGSRQRLFFSFLYNPQNCVGEKGPGGGGGES